MNKVIISIKIIITITLLTLMSCVSSDNIKKGKYLLSSNKIIIDNAKVKSEDLNSFIQQKPNKKLFGLLNVKTWIYQVSNKGKQTKFKNWVKNKFGEKPVFYNKNLTIESEKQLKRYLFSKGYFNAKITSKTKLKKRSAKVKYFIKAKEPYRIQEIKYSVKDSLLKDFVLKDSKNTLIKSGDNYDAKILAAERNRISNYLKENGYYYFSKEYIYYSVDSAINNHQVNLTINIENLRIKDKEEKKYIEKLHKRYRINNIYIYPAYNPLQADTIKYDTIVLKRNQLTTTLPSNLFLLNRGKLRLNKNLLKNKINYYPGDFYNINKVLQTRKNLTDLDIVKFVDINFEEIKNQNTDDNNYLNSKIKIIRRPVSFYSIETDGTNKAGDFGISANVIFQNRNLFKGGEVLNIKFKGAMEMKQINNSGGLEDEFLFFNTIETGMEVRLTIPKLFAPLKSRILTSTFLPKTTFITGYNYQKRLDYTRYISNFTFGYKWKNSLPKTHFLYPIDFNSVKIFKTEEFDEKLQTFDKKYQEQYSDHLILALRYSYIFNNQQIKKGNNFHYLRLNLESSGNVLSLGNKLTSSEKDEDGNYSFLNIKFAQYIRTDADFRYYHYFTSDNLIVFRSAIGIGIPYGNSKSLPFEKSFYVGGANSMRGWQIRALGPGAYNDTSMIKYDNIGDILIEENIEYRFPIYNFLKTAIFCDVGNIWLLNKSNDFPEGEFNTKNFYKQLAVDAGMGIRFDFNFFILRIDAALPIKKPTAADKWINIKKASFQDIVWNFGIGYPF
ncbi:MAG: BamA/TamA family outer membrane protein [Bacteroidales bacterium]|nr:BamA/TamA family outer membrane protein [Bacteroidales bacterium]